MAKTPQANINHVPIRYLLILCLVLSSALAVPRYALKNGESCILCHVNPSGGGLRTEYGNTLVSAEELPMKARELSYTGMISEHLQFGGDVRLQRIVAQPDSTGIQTAVFPMQADVYGSIRPYEQVEIVWKLDLLNQYHRVWSQFNILPKGGFIRFGKTVPSYGLKLDDHTSFIRGGNMSLSYGLAKEGLPFTPWLTAPITLEGGLYFGNVFLTAGISEHFITSGSYGLSFVRSLREQALSFRAEYTGSTGWGKLMVGGSVLHEGDLNLRGLFGGLSRGSLSWMGEIDWARNWAGENVSLATYNEVTYEVRQGINILLKLDNFDVDVDSSGQTIGRFTVGLDIIPLPFVQIKAQVRKSDVSDPAVEPEPEYLLQLHTWF